MTSKVIEEENSSLKLIPKFEKYNYLEQKNLVQAPNIKT